MKTKEARSILTDHFGDETGQVSFSKGAFTVREGYFYHHGRSPETLAAKVKEIFPEATILYTGDHRARFNGGASLRRSSHFWVQFTM